VPSEA